MVRVQDRPISHLTRGQRLYHRKGARAPSSLSPTQSLTAQNDVTKTLALLSAAWRSGISWVTKLTSIATQRALNLAWPRFNLGDFLPGMLRRPGFLIILILAGSIDVGMLTFIATGAQTQTDARTPSKLQDRLATVAADAAVSHTATVPATFGAETTAVFDRTSESQYPPSVAKSEIARQVVSDRTPILQPESAAQSDTVFKPSVLPKFANQAQSIPLPTRKPKKPGTAVAKRIVRQQAKEEPNPMRFGSFGFNYTDPAQ